MTTHGVNLCRHLHAQQVLKNQKVREQLLRTERELHGILQKKYDIMELARREERDRIRGKQCAGGGTVAHLSGGSNDECIPARSLDYVTLKRDSGMSDQSHHNPLGAPPQDVRRGRAVLTLADFFSFNLRDSDPSPHTTGNALSGLYWASDGAPCQSL